MATPPLPAELRKLLQRQHFVAETSLPTYRLLDVLASNEADVSTLIAKFRELKEPAMRKAFHDMAVLLRAMESTFLSPAGAAAATAPAAPASPAASASPKSASSTTIRQDAEALAALPEVKIFTDGASKGNPGPAGIAFIITDPQNISLYEVCEAIGTATNNVAEYRALLAAMRQVLALGKRRAAFFSDSELVVNQVMGRWKINNPELARLLDEIRPLRRQFEKFTIAAIPRELNRRADFLATHAIKCANAAAEAAQEGNPGA